LGFPVVLLFLIASPNRNVRYLGGSGLSAPLYFMVGLAAFGTMNSMLGAILGGVWFPVGSGGILHDVAEALPSFWLVQASHVGIGGSGWSSTGWIVVAVWTVVAARLAMRAYRRDTGRG